jgi:hypothetical protein
MLVKKEAGNEISCSMRERDFSLMITNLQHLRDEEVLHSEGSNCSLRRKKSKRCKASNRERERERERERNFFKDQP